MNTHTRSFWMPLLIGVLIGLLGPISVSAQETLVYTESFQNFTGGDVRNQEPESVTATPNLFTSNYGWYEYTSNTANLETGASAGIGAASGGNPFFDFGYYFSFMFGNPYYTLVWTDESPVTRTPTNEVSRITFEVRNGPATRSGASVYPTYFAVRIGGQWYMTTSDFDLNNDSGENVWTPKEFQWTTAASAWRRITLTEANPLWGKHLVPDLAPGAVLSSPLPDGNIEAFGIFFDRVGGVINNSSARFDELKVYTEVVEQTDFELRVRPRPGGGIIFTTRAGKSYQVKTSTTLADGSFVNVGSPIPGTGGEVEYPDSIPDGRLFYCVEEL